MAMFYPYSNANLYKGIYNMNIEGEGRISVSPDTSIISVGIVTENKELKIAQNENSRKTNNIINSLKGMEIKDKDIKTESYNIYPEYDYIDGKQVFRGYKVVNNLRVTIRDIQKTGEVIDKAVESGANVVNSISFTLANKSKYYNIALNNAVKNAIEKSRNLGDTLGVLVDKIPLNIYEESYNLGFTTSQSLLKTADASTPIESGQIEIIAKIRCIFSYKRN